jgi:Ca2+-binding EF-hand superfamily protein
MKKLVIVGLFAISANAMAVDRVLKFDTDLDGKVSYKELTLSCDVSKSLFDRADKDGDGYLTNVEMRTAKNYLFVTCSK